MARCEAGIPSNAPFYVKSKSTSKKYTIEGRNTSDYVPISKKGVQAWNYISQENAKKAAEKMYSGNRYVTSQLVDGIAWDRTVDWIVDSGKYVDIQKDSSNYGNYNNNKEISESSILWAEHLTVIDITDNVQEDKGKYSGKNYHYGQFNSGANSNWTENTKYAVRRGGSLIYTVQSNKLFRKLEQEQKNHKYKQGAEWKL